jgi:hypothetical protein
MIDTSIECDAGTFWIDTDSGEITIGIDTHAGETGATAVSPLRALEICAPLERAATEAIAQQREARLAEFVGMHPEVVRFVEGEEADV